MVRFYYWGVLVLLGGAVVVGSYVMGKKDCQLVQAEREYTEETGKIANIARIQQKVQQTAADTGDAGVREWLRSKYTIKD